MSTVEEVKSAAERFTGALGKMRQSSEKHASSSSSKSSGTVTPSEYTDGHEAMPITAGSAASATSMDFVLDS